MLKSPFTDERVQEIKRPLDNLRTRFFVYFGLLFTIVAVITQIADVFGVRLLGYAGQWETRQAETFRNLTMVADLKKERLERLLKERKDDIKIFADSKLLPLNVASLREAASEAMAQSANIDDFRRVMKGQRGYLALQALLNNISETYGVYQEIMLIDADSGLVLAGADEQLIGLDVRQEPWYPSQLQPRDTYLSAVQKNIRTNKPIQYLARGLIDIDPLTLQPHGQHLIALLVLGLDLTDLFTPELHSVAGLASSQETVLVDEQQRLLVPLKHSPEGGKPALPLEYRITAEPARLAAQGKELNSLYSNDYRGRPVLAATRYIRISPDHGWGLVVKCDQDELFAPIYASFFQTLVFTAIGILVMLGLTYIITRHVTTPVEILSRVTQRVAQGNLSERAEIIGTIEIRRLAVAFNEMVQRLQAAHDELEAQVRQRTTALEESVETLQRHRNMLAHILNSIPQAIYWKDRNGVYLGCNDVHARVAGLLDSNQMIGKTDDDLPWAEETAKYRAEDQEVLATQRPQYHVIQQMRRGNGANRWIDTTKIPLTDDTGQIYGVLGVDEDITEQKEAENALEILNRQLLKERDNAQRYLNIVGAVLVAIDRQQNITLLNKKGCELLGITQEEALGSNWFDRFVPEHIRAATKKAFNHLMAGELEPVEYFENEVVTRTGEERLLAWHNSLLRDEAGNTVGTLSSGEDITERRRAEKALRESETRFRTVADYTFDWEYWRAPAGHMIYISPSCEAITGYKPAEFEDNPDLISGIVHPDDRAIWGEHERVALAGDLSHVELEFRVLTKTGQARWIGHVCRTIYDNNGQFLGVRASNRDITERWEAEEALRQSEHRFRSLFETMTEGVALHELVRDDQGQVVNYRLLDINPAYERHTGLKQSKVVNHLGTEAYNATPAPYLAEFQQVAITGIPMVLETYFPPMDKHFNISIFSPEPDRFVTVFEDITKRRQDEEAARKAHEQVISILSSISDAFFALDENMVVTYFNTAAEQTLNRSAQDVLGQKLFDAFPEARGTIFETRYHKALTEQCLDSFEVYFDAERYRNWYEVRVYPRHPGISVYFRVTTERKRAEEELARHRDHLEELVLQRTRELHEAQAELVRKERLATLGQLIGIVSHEIRNPLGTIRTSFYSIAERIRGKETGAEKAMERAERNIERCDRLIEELLDYSREKMLLLEPIDIDSWIGEIVTEQQLSTEIRIEQDLLANAQVAVDRERFRRCVINLLTNATQAIEAKRSSGGLVRVSSRIQNDRVEVCVSDNGTGISKEDLAKVFEPLYSTRSFGIGLGLCIVKQIMEKHKGGVEISSVLGEGTTMTLWIPIQAGTGAP